MDDSTATRLVETALRCYPSRWRRRHGDEAAELAALLIKDGTPAVSIAVSYLAGAVREWLTPHPRRLGAVACALLVAACALGVSTALLASTMPAKAASTSQVPAPAQCPSHSPVPVPAMVAAMDHQHMIIWEAWHVRPC
jgi:hypothetical protein